MSAPAVAQPAANTPNRKPQSHDPADQDADAVSSRLSAQISHRGKQTCESIAVRLFLRLVHEVSG
jgi:hypothetical protein